MNNSEGLNRSQSPPPPAYSEQEFDQKILLASELSQATQQHQVQHEEDTWEVWDDAVFQEAANRLNGLSVGGSDQPQTAGSSSSNGQSPGSGRNGDIHPLRVHKKNPSGGSSSTSSGKPKPSWLAEAEGNTMPGCSTYIAPVAPSYTPTAPPGSILPTLDYTAPPNHYPDQEWGATSSGPTLTGPYHYDQNGVPSEPFHALPPLVGNSFPPPFLPNAGGRPPYSDVIPDVQLGPTFPATSPDIGPPPGARPTSMPVRPSAYANNTSTYNQQHMLTPQQSASPGASYSGPSRSRHSVATSAPSGHSQYINQPNSPSPPGGPAADTYRNSEFPPRNAVIPRINVDLSVAYGKRPVVASVSEPPPPQVVNAAAFYNAAVSPHFGSMYSKQPVKSFEHARQPQRFPTNINDSTYSLQQTAPLTPNRYSHLPPGSVPPQNPHNLSMPQNPLIRSPTPTYPVSAANSTPQLLVVANEGYYGPQPVTTYPMAHGQVHWTEPYSNYR